MRQLDIACQPHHGHYVGVKFETNEGGCKAYWDSLFSGFRGAKFSFTLGTLYDNGSGAVTVVKLQTGCNPVTKFVARGLSRDSTSEKLFLLQRPGS